MSLKLVHSTILRLRRNSITADATRCLGAYRYIGISNDGIDFFIRTSLQLDSWSGHRDLE